MENITLSLIIPVYNVENYLDSCLHSVTAQTLTGLEILIVNDGSTDGSSRIIDSYAKKDSRIRVITTANRGVSEARNTGAAQARGKYLWFIDGDDFIESEVCRPLYEKAVETNCDLLLFDFSYDDRKEQTSVTVHPRVDGFPDHVYSSENHDVFCLKKHPDGLAKMQSFVWEKLISRNYWKNHHFSFPKGKRFEDLPVSFEMCAKADCIAYLPLHCYHYRINVGFLGTSREKNLDPTKIFFLTYYNFRKEKLWNSYQKALVYLFIRHVFYRFRHIIHDTSPGNYKIRRRITGKLFLFLRLIDKEWRHNPLISQNLPKSLSAYWPLFCSRPKMLTALKTANGMNPQELELYLQSFNKFRSNSARPEHIISTEITGR